MVGMDEWMGWMSGWVGGGWGGRERLEEERKSGGVRVRSGAERANDKTDG